jgi:hypothetical protein
LRKCSDSKAVALKEYYNYSLLIAAASHSKKWEQNDTTDRCTKNLKISTTIGKILEFIK